MRVAVVSLWAIHKQAIGGTERFVVDLAESLASLGHTVDVYMLSGRSHTTKGVRYIGLDFFGKHVIADEYEVSKRFGEMSTVADYDSLATEFEELIDGDTYDLIQLNSLVFLRAWRNCRRILVHHSNPSDIVKPDAQDSGRLLVGMIRTEMNSVNTSFVAPSAASVREWDRLVGPGTFCIPHAVSRDRLTSKYSDTLLAKQAYGIDTDLITILFPSRLEETQKQPKLLLEACVLLPDSLKAKIQLVFTGIDEQYKKNVRELDERARETGVNARFIRFKSINDGYKAADLVAVPSRYESFGYSALESLALGLPTFMSNLPSFHEIAEGNPQAIFFDGTPQDLSTKLASNLQHLARKQAPSPAWLRRYDLLVWANKYASLANAEVRDLYDEKRRHTGQVIRKGQRVPQGRYYLTVVTWITNTKGELLLQLTSQQKEHKWSTTGGHPKAGQTSLQGIATEVFEELGVTIDSSEFVLFKTVQTEDDFVDLYYVRKNIDISSLRLQPEEVESAKWATIEEINTMIQSGSFLAPHVEFLQMYLKNVEKK